MAQETTSSNVTFPKRNTKFRLEDFFQTEVDEFYKGDFLFLSAKKVKTKSNDKLLDKLKFFDEYGWVISTWSYTRKYYYKIFVCQFKQKGWENEYRIRWSLAELNGCDDYSINTSIAEFLDWMQTENLPRFGN
ncbi:MAG: hypothetical protein ACOVNU_02785 [Candidatus Kapaibacteriota bacterium]